MSIPKEADSTSTITCSSTPASRTQQMSPYQGKRGVWSSPTSMSGLVLRLILWGIISVALVVSSISWAKGIGNGLLGTFFLGVCMGGLITLSELLLTSSLLTLLDWNRFKGTSSRWRDGRG